LNNIFQRSKDDLGLDHFEGRSWRGFHHHLALSALAYLFILTIYLEAKKNFWSDVGEDPGIDPALAAAIDRTLSLLPRHPLRKSTILLNRVILGGPKPKRKIPVLCSKSVNLRKADLRSHLHK
jgi:hypothetical protein